jgi:hypothetical protein
MTTHQLSCRHRAPRMVMWTAIAASAALLAVLLRQGWGDRAWSIAGGLLVLCCIAVCIWAAVTGNRSTRAVEREVARLAETRRRTARSAGPPPRPPHGQHRPQTGPMVDT